MPLLARFTRVQSLHYDYGEDIVNRRALLEVARLPRLQKLTMSGRLTRKSFDAATEVSGEPFFPALGHLAVRAIEDVEAFSALLSRIKRPSLRALEVGCSTPDDANALAEAISSCEQLGTLSLACAEPTHIPETVLEPLTKLQHLDSVHVRDVLLPPEERRSPTDLGPIHLVTHWHGLRTLRLDSSDWWLGRGTPHRLELLPMLAKHCPKLELLRAAISAEEVPARDSLQHKSIRRETPLRLVQRFPFKADVQEAAEYICDVYPCIEIIFFEAHDIDARECQEKWKEVGKLVKRVAATREAGLKIMVEELAAEGEDSECAL